MGMENARLNRLLNLLADTKTSPGLKRSVGKQVAHVVESDVEGLLLPTLKRILPGLFSNEPEQRSGIAFCLALLFPKNSNETGISKICDDISGLDLQKEGDEREVLLASRGNEYELSQKVDAKQQKQAVSSALAIAPGLDSLSEGLIEEKDFSPEDAELSVRQRAMMKRRAKQKEEDSRRARIETISVDSLKDGRQDELKKQVQELLNSALLHPNWDVRHGALLGVKALGGECGYCLKNLLLLLTLDSFVDFNGGDSATAPVREEASQILYEYLKEYADDMVKPILHKFQFMLQTEATWNQNLTAFLIYSKCIPLLKDSLIEYSEAVKQIIEEVDDDEVVNNALSLLQVIPSISLDDGLKERLLRMLPEFGDLSLGPAHVFTILKGTEIKVDLVVAFLRHKLSRVRLAAAEFTLTALQGNLIILSDYLAQQLFQVLLFEEDEAIAGVCQLAIQNFLKEDDACWTRWIKILSVPIDKPLPLEHLYEFKLTHSGTLQVVAKSVPEWELGVKAADIMLLSPRVIWSRRRRAALAVKIPQDKRESIRMAFVKSSHGYHKLLAYWLGLALGDINTQIIECNDQAEQVKELWALRLKAITKKVEMEEYAILIKNEKIDVLMEDFAKDCALLVDNNLLLAKSLFKDISDVNALQFICKYLKSPAFEVLKVIGNDLVLVDFYFRALSVKPDLPNDDAMLLYKRGMEAQNHLLIAAMVEKHLLKSDLLEASFESTPSLFLALISELVKMEEDEEVVALLPAFIPLALKLMSDDERAAALFASLLRLAPLVDTSEAIHPRVQSGLDFIKGLSNPGSIVQDIKPPVQLGKVELRHYQEEGFRWLVFLQQSGLHGALCDDMGLGKTLQTLCAIVHKINLHSKITSLIVCPSSLTGHWQREAATYYPHLKTALYLGKERKEVLNKKSNVDILISSYEVVRNDIDSLKMHKFAYVVLDEGHVIRNAKSKVSLAVRQLKAEHRLILTGTPIQNNVLELWTLFDFLMPGYLGRDQRAFIEKYANPIMAVSASKSSVKDFEAAEEMLKILHRQVLPFILRRMKEEVLKELPPKIIQDYYCEMTVEQKDVMKKLEGAFEDGENNNKDGVLQAIHKMQLASVHPGLVKCVEELDYRESPKLLMLRDILVECGYSPADDDSVTIDNNRLLVFAQHRTVLNLVERMLKEDFGNCKYLRLDGQVPSEQRADLAHRFNDDPSYGVFLLTTSVGGLGLNLTGADTVVFLQHDWNPQRDLQAMDRAHRLGQKRTVNVYRLITRGSVEERVMGLQAWKLRVARTLVSHENTSFTEMARMGDITELLSQNTTCTTDTTVINDNEVLLGMSKLERMLLELDQSPSSTLMDQ